MKTALITGGTSGVGRSIAEALVEQDYEVTIVGSDPERGKAVETALNGERLGRARFVRVDLSSVRATREFSDQFLENHNNLDVLANIAGSAFPERSITSEGNERTFAIGCLSSFVLSNRLAPLLESAPNGRIVNVAGLFSVISKIKLDFDDLTFSTNYGGVRANLATTRAKTILTQILSERYASADIDVNAFHPGFVRSNFPKNMSFLVRAMNFVVSPFLSKSSKTGIYACSSPKLRGTTGKLLEGKSAITLVFDNEDKERLWQEIQRLCRTAENCSTD